MSYLLDSAHELARERFQVLDLLFDGPSRAVLRRFLDTRPKVWEVGCGDGSLAVWMASQGAQVVASDVDLGPLSGMGNHLAANADRLPTVAGITPDGQEARMIEGLEFVVHRLGSDPLPDETFDLIHARCVIQHLPAPGRRLAELASRLNPGGVLVISELDPVMPYGALMPPGRPRTLVDDVGDAFTRALRAAGASPDLGRFLDRAFAAVGLTNITHHGHVTMHRELAARLMLANARQCRLQLLAQGISLEELTAYVEFVEARTHTLMLPVLFTATGRAA